MSDFLSMVEDTFDTSDPSLDFTGAFSAEGALTASAPMLEKNTIYGARIIGLGDENRKVRTLPANGDKAPVRILPFRIVVFLFKEDGSYDTVERWLADIWIKGAHQNMKADFGKFFQLCNACLADEMPKDGNGDYVIDDQYTINWYISQLIDSAPLRVKSSERKYINKDKEEKTQLVFYPHSPWPEGRDL